MKKILLVIAVLAFVSSASASWALWGPKKSLQGIVDDIHSNMLVVQNRASDSKPTTTVEVNSKTKYQEIGSLRDLNEGDMVKVEYKQEAGKNIATTVAKLQSDQSLGIDRGTEHSDMSSPSQDEANPNNFGKTY